MKYRLYIIDFKKIYSTKKEWRNIKSESIKFYDKISFDLAKHLISQHGMGMRFLDKKENLCFKEKAYKALAYDGRNRIGIALPIVKNKFDFESELGIHIITDCFKFDSNFINFNQIKDLLKNYDENFFEYSIESAHIWGPKSLIPKGYEHITSGKIQKGDFYFDCYYDHDCSGHWVSCDVSYSRYRPFTEIQLFGHLYQGKHKGRIENELLQTYNAFIIRKKA